MLANGRALGPSLLPTLALLVACGGHGNAPVDSPAASVARTVGALGRLEPGRGVVSVGGMQGERVARLLVVEGQRVAAGDVLAYLESHDLRLAERSAAAAAVAEAGRRLQAEADFAEARIHEAESSIQLYETEIDQARRDLERISELRTAETVSEQRVEEQRLQTRSVELALERARAQRRTAEADLARARSAVGLEALQQELAAAAARLELTVVRAPIDGRVLEVYTYPGETVGASPILDMGDTDNMYAVAEVYETDVARVKVGDRATIESAALGRGEAGLSGHVEEIGWMIFKNDVLDIDPRADTDTRVVQVRVKLDDPSPALHLTHHEVRVQIQATGG